MFSLFQLLSDRMAKVETHGEESILFGCKLCCDIFSRAHRLEMNAMPHTAKLGGPPHPSHPPPTPNLPSAAKDSRPALAFLNMSSTDTLMWSVCTLMWSVCDAWNLKLTKREADKKKEKWEALKKLANPPAVEPSPLSDPTTQLVGGPNPSVKT